MHLKASCSGMVSFIWFCGYVFFLVIVHGAIWNLEGCHSGATGCLIRPAYLTAGLSTIPGSGAQIYDNLLSPTTLTFKVYCPPVYYAILFDAFAPASPKIYPPYASPVDA